MLIAYAYRLRFSQVVLPEIHREWVALCRLAYAYNGYIYQYAERVYLRACLQVKSMV
jgi:hypothetical protein